jgi:hypothetical protein
VARRPADDDDGDFSIDLRTGQKTAQPKVPAPTMELETSDLKDMMQIGEAKAKPNLVIQLDSGKRVELEPGWSHEPPADFVDYSAPSIIVADDMLPGAQPVAAAARPAPARAREARDSSVWLVVLAYLVAATALALAIYERFFM